MRQATAIPDLTRRLVSGPRVVFVLCLLPFVLAIFRLASLQLGTTVPRTDGMVRRTIPARRGTIYDRYGRPLALNATGYSVFVHPHLLSDPQQVANALAQALHLDPAQVARATRSSEPFVWIKRLIPDDELALVKPLAERERGVGLKPEPKRIYPYHKMLAPILGFTGVDNQGLAGIELSQNALLRGSDGERLCSLDANGTPIPTSSFIVHDVQHGSDIYLTIDADIQAICERELAEAISRYHARGGTVTVLDPKTGEILAAVTQPSFDPNRFYLEKDQRRFNATIASITYEPGSTVKGIVVAAALDAGCLSPTERFQCTGSKVVYDYKISCPHAPPGGHGWLTPRDIIRVSCNVCAADVGKRLGSARMLRYFRDFGFLGPTHVGIYEETGSVPPYRGPVWVATASYGQGISVTPLQLAAAYAAIANGGVLLRPRLIAKYTLPGSHRFKHTQPTVIHRVISESVARRVMSYLVDVVNKPGGTGAAARLKQYLVAGKTGTAQKAGPRGLASDKYVVSFVGMLPADDPKFVILVTVDEPDPAAAYGGTVAAPAFRDIAEGIATLKALPPSALP